MCFLMGIKTHVKYIILNLVEIVISVFTFRGTALRLFLFKKNVYRGNLVMTCQKRIRHLSTIDKSPRVKISFLCVHPHLTNDPTK